jgi:hypothetical protein
MTIAIISTLVSSVALAGVAVSLLFQSRQLRVAQLQAVRGAQLELMRMALDNPVLAGEIAGVVDPGLLARQVFMNWNINYLELGFQVGVISASSLRMNAAMLFESKMVRDWWESDRATYVEAKISRRTKFFFSIVDGEFQRLHQAEAASATASPVPGQPDSSAPNASPPPAMPPTEAS